MDNKSASSLFRRLGEKQRWKRVGVISAPDLARFLALIDDMEILANTIPSISVLDADLLPSTSSGNYESVRHQTYYGPRTVVRYSSGEYEIERRRGAYSYDRNGEYGRVRIVAEVSCIQGLAEILHLFRWDADSASLRVEEREEGFRLTFLLPLDRLRRGGCATQE